MSARTIEELIEEQNRLLAEQNKLLQAQLAQPKYDAAANVIANAEIRERARRNTPWGCKPPIWAR